MDRESIVKTLSVVDKFDATASPFVALRLADAKIYRSSSFGFLASKNMVVDKDSVFVSLTHLHDCLKAMPEDEIEFGLDGGVLFVKSINSAFESKLRVHTIPATEAAKAGMKHHAMGKFSAVLKPGLFSGFNSKPFAVAAPPLLVEGRLLLSTPHGIVMWQGPDALKDVKMHPRESFLRFISSGVDEIYLTDTDYWGATNGSLVMFLSGHNLGTELHQAYAVAGDKVADLPAARLVTALGAAAVLCDSQRKVEIGPDKGVVTRNGFGNLQEFALGPQKGWTPFSIFGQTARLVHDALQQASGDVATLSALSGMSYPTMRLSRGAWEVSFKIF